MVAVCRDLVSRVNSSAFHNTYFPSEFSSNVFLKTDTPIGKIFNTFTGMISFQKYNLVFEFEKITFLVVLSITSDLQLSFILPTKHIFAGLEEKTNNLTKIA